MNERVAANTVIAINLAFGLAVILFLRILSPYVINSSRWPWVACGIVYVLLCLPVLRAAGSHARVALLVLFFAPLSWFPFNSQERFLVDLFSIEPGMSRQQVEEVMVGYMRGTGWPANPFTPTSGELTIRDCEVFRHSNHGNHDSDWGVVCYSDQGAVSKVEFYPD